MAGVLISHVLHFLLLPMFWFHMFYISCSFLFIGDTCWLQEGQREGNVQEEGRCTGGAVHVRLFTPLAASITSWFAWLCNTGGLEFVFCLKWLEFYFPVPTFYSAIPNLKQPSKQCTATTWNAWWVNVLVVQMVVALRLLVGRQIFISVKYRILMAWNELLPL